MTVTPDGAAYYERTARLLNDLDDIEASMTNAQASPSGRLRVDVGTSIARQMVGRWGMSPRVGQVSVLPGPSAVTAALAAGRRSEASRLASVYLAEAQLPSERRAAIQRAFQEFLASGRQPVVVLFIDVDPPSLAVRNASACVRRNTSDTRAPPPSLPARSAGAPPRPPPVAAAS